MREGWNKYKFKDVATAVKGKLPNSKNEDGVGVPYLTANYLRSNNADFWIENLEGAITARDGDCLILWDGAGAGDLFSAKNGVVSSTMAVVTTTRSDILREYLTLFVSSKKDYIKETCRGTTVPHVSPDAISNMELAIPPLPEQKRIVDLISSIDSYIVALEQHVASARKLRMTILETKLDELSKLYGSVPLSSVCGNSKQSIVDGPFGSRLQRRDYLKEGIPVLKLQNIKEGFILKKNMDYVSESKYKELIRHSFLVGDLVITKLGDPLGVSSIVSDIEKGLIVADLVRIRPESIDAKFLCMQINSNAIKYHLNRLQKGSTRPRINLGMVRDLPIVSPPKDQALQCTTLISSFDDLIKATEDSLLKQKQLRSGLLADLLSGQHLIPESYDKVMGVAV